MIKEILNFNNAVTLKNIDHAIKFEGFILFKWVTMPFFVIYVIRDHHS